MSHRVVTRRAGRRPARWLVPNGAILSFHSVTTPALPAAGSAHVPLDTFKSMIRSLRFVAEFVPLSDFVRRRLQGLDTSGLIAITLDDAYAALTCEFSQFIAAEALPVAVFVVTGATEMGQEFWWDRVDDAQARASRGRWRAFEAECGLPESYRRGQPKAYGPLRPFRQWLLATHAGRWPARLAPALRALEEDVGHQTLHRAMNVRELGALAALPEVEIGVHTITHPVLPLLSEPDVEREIAGGFLALREQLASVLPILAVPYGLYDERTLRVARRSGMIVSLTLGGETGRGPDPLALSRFCVTTDDTPARLVMRLSGLPGLVRGWSGRHRSAYPDLPSPTS